MNQNALSSIKAVVLAAAVMATSPVIGEVIITEIMYNPATLETNGEGEWIEICNKGSSIIDLSGWTFDDEDAGLSDNWGAIPVETTIAAGQFAVIFNSAFTDETNFRASWAVTAGTLVVGVPWGLLSNSPVDSSDEVLRLFDEGAALVDEVNYDDNGIWPADNNVSSITLDLGSYDSSANDDGSNWSLSTIANGSVHPVMGGIYDVGDLGSPGFEPVSTNVYARWIAEFSVGVMTSFEDDPNQNGIENGLENVFGQDPSADGNTKSPFSAVSKIGNVFRFRHPLNESVVSDVTWYYQWSADGKTWNASGVSNDATIVTFGSPNVVDDSPTGFDIVENTATITGREPGRLFVRIGAEM